MKVKAGLIHDILIGAVLFAATAGFCLWQSTRVVALFDISYLLETSWRIALGQLPYRDFPFAHAPGTFLLHAMLIKMFGRLYWPHIACAAIESGTATLLTWRILLRTLRPLRTNVEWVAVLLSTTLVPLGICSIGPHSSYDGECIVTVLLTLFFVAGVVDQWDLEPTAANPHATTCRIAIRNVAAGAASIAPVFFKQNIGLAFLAAIFASVTAIVIVHALRRQSLALQLWFLAGTITATAVAALAVHATVGLANYRYWTMTFAAQRRLPRIATLVGMYRQASLRWTIPAALAGFTLLRMQRTKDILRARILAILLLSIPFFWTLIALALTNDPDDRADQLLSLWPHLLVLAVILAIVQMVRCVRGRASTLTALLPILFLATIHGAFLSQQLWGSTYAIWPLLILLVALLLLEVREVAAPLAVVISATLLLCGSLYASSLERLDYIHLDGTVAHASLPTLHGMATPGPWLAEFENMVNFTNSTIPADDGIVLIPGEEPFYFVTGRVPHFPVLLTDLATDPYTPQQTAAEIRARNIRWLIVKRNLQLTEPPDYETSELLQAIRQDFVLYRRLPGYDIYRRP